MASQLWLEGFVSTRLDFLGIFPWVSTVCTHTLLARIRPNAWSVAVGGRDLVETISPRCGRRGNSVPELVAACGSRSSAERSPNSGSEEGKTATTSDENNPSPLLLSRDLSLPFHGTTRRSLNCGLIIQIEGQRTPLACGFLSPDCFAVGQWLCACGGDAVREA